MKAKAKSMIYQLVVIVVVGSVLGFNTYLIPVASAQQVSDEQIRRVIDEAQNEKAGKNPFFSTTASKPDLLSYIGGEDNYTLGENDVVQILVRGQDDFSGHFVIGPDGKIQYPYIGDIQAAGLTKTQLKEIVIEALKRFVKVPSVSVVIAEYRSKFIYVMGEVARPGKLPMKGDTITLRDAIVESGLPTRDAAIKRVHVVSPDPNDPTFRVINMKDILYKGILVDNVDLHPGEIIVVPTSYPSAFNRFLDLLISPIYKAAVVASVDDMVR